jgi:disulfide bond formation protein DsbB
VTNTVSLVLAAGAIVLQVLLLAVALVALAAIALPGARTLLAEIRETLLGSEVWLAWGVALIATLGSMYFSEVAHFQPCRLCWFQRIAMYPLAVVLLVAALRRDGREAALYGLAFPILGGLVSIYHLYIEANPEAETASCKVGASCATKWIDKFGWVTIPMLALTAFITIATLLLFARSRARTAA